MTGLHGEYLRKLNGGRVRIPADLRAQLPDKLVIFESIGGDCLWLMGDEDFDAWLAKLFESRFGGYDPSNKAHMLARSTILARVLPCKMGQAGSASIPAELRERLGLNSSAVLVGVSDHVEIWNPDTWDSAQAQMRGDGVSGRQPERAQCIQ